LALWAASLGTAIILGYFGQVGLGQVQRYLGNVNLQWLSGLGHRGGDVASNRTALGRIGRIKTSGRIVIRLEAAAGPSPPLLREATYRSYKQQTWFAEFNDKETATVLAETNSNTFVLMRGRTNTATVNIACFLDGGRGVLPLPPGCGRLENLSWYLPLQRTPLGAVLVQQGPDLVVFDAFYGHGATFDSAPNTIDDLAVPPKESNALTQVVADLHLDGQTREQKLRTLREFFQDNFTYRMWQEVGRMAGTNETPLSRFLLHSHAGHCEYFATAGVLLLRQAHIPARYAVGYAVHEGSGGKFVVRQRDAHAWCLVWNEKVGRWQDFDFTPASWVDVESQHASVFQSLADGWSWLGFEFAKLRWGQTRLRQYLLWGLVPVLAILLYQIISHSRLHRRRTDADSAWAQPWPGLDSEFYQLENQLLARGFARQPGEPLSAWLGRAIQDTALADLRTALAGLLRLHYRYRFDPLGLNPDEREQLKREAQACLAKVER
jgi:hypothetical protein